MFSRTITIDPIGHACETTRSTCQIKLKPFSPLYFHKCNLYNLHRMMQTLVNYVPKASTLHVILEGTILKM